MNELTDEIVVLPWLVFNTIGQVLILILLLTYIFAQDIPHRRNLYLLSMLAGIFLTSIPPNLMLYVGRVLSKSVPANLCLAQMTMMDTVPLLVFLVIAILVLDNLVELCHLRLHSRHFTRRAIVYSILLVFPYFLITVLTIWSYFVVVTHDSNPFQQTEGLHWVWCRTNNNGSSSMVQPAMNILALVVAVINFFLEVGILVMIYVFPIKEECDLKTWQTTSSFALRGACVVLIQLVTGILIAAQPIRRNLEDIDFPYKIAFEMIESMSGILVFLVFGTQKVILRKWASWAVIIWRKICRTPEEDPDVPQPFELPSLEQYSPLPAYQIHTSQWDDDSVLSTDKEKKGRFRKFFKVPSFPLLPLWKRRGASSAG